MKNINTQQTEVMNAPNSTFETPHSPLTKGCLQVFTHFDEKASNGAEIEEMNLKNDDEIKNANDDLWEDNHALITKAIHELMRHLGRVPTKKELAVKTGLSRPTVHKHLHGFAMHPLFVEKEEQFQMLSSNVMARVYEFAMLGDPRAARLYFEITGRLK